MFHKADYSGWSAQVTDEYKDLFNQEVLNILDERNKQIFQSNLVKMERYKISEESECTTHGMIKRSMIIQFLVLHKVYPALLSSQGYGDKAKKSLISKIENLEKEIEQIRNEEISKVDGYNFESKVVEVLQCTNI